MIRMEIGSLEFRFHVKWVFSPQLLFAKVHLPFRLLQKYLSLLFYFSSYHFNRGLSITSPVIPPNDQTTVDPAERWDTVSNKTFRARCNLFWQCRRLLKNRFVDEYRWGSISMEDRRSSKSQDREREYRGNLAKTVRGLVRQTARNRWNGMKQ